MYNNVILRVAGRIVELPAELQGVHQKVLQNLQSRLDCNLQVIILRLLPRAIEHAWSDVSNIA